jgi:hypothetical protein
VRVQPAIFFPLDCRFCGSDIVMLALISVQSADAGTQFKNKTVFPFLYN